MAIVILLATGIGLYLNGENLAGRMTIKKIPKAYNEENFQKYKETIATYICNDKKDNDNDGLVDFGKDPGCSGIEDSDEYNPPECLDGIDNETPPWNDEKIDYPEDPGCESLTDNIEYNEYQCSDQKDNDGDGKKDFYNGVIGFAQNPDPGCSSLSDDDESN